MNRPAYTAMKTSLPMRRAEVHTLPAGGATLNVQELRGGAWTQVQDKTYRSLKTAIKAANSATR